MPVHIAILLFSILFLGSANVSYGNGCAFASFEHCIRHEIESRIEKETTSTKAERKRLKKLSIAQNNRNLFGTPDSFYDYHRALLNVLPDKSQRIKKSIISQIVSEKTETQTKLLTNLSLIEAFTGDTKSAIHTINFAIKTNNNSHKSRIVSHLIEQTEDYIENTIKPLGYQLNICDSPEEQIQASLILAVDKNHHHFLQVVESIPSDELKISILLLTSTYIKKVNNCQFLSDFFENQILNIIARQAKLSRAAELANSTINSYRLLQ